MYKQEVRGELIGSKKTLDQITTDIVYPLEQRIKTWWVFTLMIASLAAMWGMYSIYMTVSRGIGMWGENHTVAWGWEIINFVWWIGIGHAGTAFSIFLLILRQRWRSSINRAAEAMTVFAVICAALFPLLHMGRVWLAFFIFPYPNTRGPLWVNFNSPLFWDVVAISSYLLISASFWYLGLIPDFATVRDKTPSKIKKAVYGFFSLGWTGSLKNWKRYEALSFVLGGIAAVLVVSVHSIVSTDFASSVIPGWHASIFPPFFVVGAIFSGFAMVLTLVIIMRKFYNMGNYITDSHLNAIAKILIFISLIMGVAYLTEIFIAWFSGNPYEFYTFYKNRITGDYALEFWAMIACNVFFPQLFWFKKIRKNILLLFIISLFINLGMWYERYIIIVTSLSKDYLPANWAPYHPSITEIGIYVGTLGIFVSCLMLFFRYIPMIAIHELKGVVKLDRKTD